MATAFVPTPPGHVSYSSMSQLVADHHHTIFTSLRCVLRRILRHHLRASGLPYGEHVICCKSINPSQSVMVLTMVSVGSGLVRRAHCVRHCSWVSDSKDIHLIIINHLMLATMLSILTTSLATCSNMGTCDRTTGLCKCRHGAS